jgi:RND superfamily putative drug exporter
VRNSFPTSSASFKGGTGQDRRSTVVAVGFDQDKDSIAQRIPDFRALLSAGGAAGPARSYLTGDPIVANEIELDTQADTEHAEMVALPIALLVLLIVVGTFVAGLMPLLLAAVAVSVSLAVIYAIALHLETNIFVLNFASIIGLGLSIDYSLFITRRFREELARGRPVGEAVAWTVAKAGEAIPFSGITVIIGFAGLLLIGIQIMTSFGIGGIAVASTAVLAALTLLPALLGVVGLRISALHLQLLSRFAGHLRRHAMRTGGTPGERPGFWHNWAVQVMRRPILIIFLVTVILIGLGWPASSLNPGVPDASALPAGSEARSSLAILKAQIPATHADPIYLIAQAPDGSRMLTRQNLARLDALTLWIAAQPHVTQVISLTRLLKAPDSVLLNREQLTRLYKTGAYRSDPALAQFVTSTTVGNTTLITVASDTPSDTSAGQALVDLVYREPVRPRPEQRVDEVVFNGTADSGECVQNILLQPTKFSKKLSSACRLA